MSETTMKKSEVKGNARKIVKRLKRNGSVRFVVIEHVHDARTMFQYITWKMSKAKSGVRLLQLSAGSVAQLRDIRKLDDIIPGEYLMFRSGKAKKSCIL